MQLYFYFLFKGKRTEYNFKCPYDSCNYQNKDLSRHLTAKHKWEKVNAVLEQSTRLRMARYICKITHHGGYRPSVCSDCNKCFDRLDAHVVQVHEKSRLDANFASFLNKIKKEPTINFFVNKPHAPLTTIPATSITSSSDATTQSLLRRGKEPINKGFEKAYVVMKNKLRLTRNDKRQFKIINENFRYHYKSTDPLFIDLKSWLVNSYNKSEDNATQTINNIKTIWQKVG